MYRRHSCAELIAYRNVQTVLHRLPAELKEVVAQCSIELVMMADCLQEEPELEPGLLGLFEGASRMDTHDALHPADLPRIRLFIDVLWDYAEGNPSIFSEEVRTTLLHELGHYLGLDEVDLIARGLG
jgi:predicted Zn-dependent protease with MMP-like domain